MYFDINAIVDRELCSIDKVYKKVKSSLEEVNETKYGRTKEGAEHSADKEEDSIYTRATKDEIMYYKHINKKGKRTSVKIGGPESKEVIAIKQRKYNEEMLKALESDRHLLQTMQGKFVPYDPDSIDEHIKPVYLDRTGLVNKAPGVVDLNEWNQINKRNSYPMPDDPNVAVDGLETRSKSELIVYSIFKMYGLKIKYDYEIRLKNDTGQTVAVSPDFVILCNDGSLIIVEHLGLLDDDKYLGNALKRIHLYLINGYKLNENLFLTADYAKNRINAQAIDELVRTMILPKVE